MKHVTTVFLQECILVDNNDYFYFLYFLMGVRRDVVSVERRELQCIS